jgi:DNA (cytosine-5)-methyltransferase 1
LSKFVEYFNPGYVVIENVPGIFSKSDSPLQGFISFLEDKEYFVDRKIIKVNDYGVPQTRKRFVLIASRIKKISIPAPVEDKSLTVRNFIGDEKNFLELTEGHKDDSDLCHTTAGFGRNEFKAFGIDKT